MCNAYTVRPKVSAHGLDQLLSTEIARLPTPLVRRLGRGVVLRKSGDDLVPKTMRWGFPHPKYKSVNNARSENLKRGMWVEPMAERRCLVPISCFYEWRKFPGKSKQPYEIRIPDEDWLWVAGVYGHDEAGDPCYATITTEPTTAFATIHDRLLAIVGFEEGLAFLEGKKSTIAPYGGQLAVTPCESPLKRPRAEPDDPQGQLF